MVGWPHACAGHLLVDYVNYGPVKGAWKLLRINWISNYCVYTTNSLEVDLALEYKLAFFLELF